MTLLTQKRISGFTLIEIMVTVAIIGLLAAIVWPTYEAQLKKQRRKSAIVTVLQVAQDMQKCKTDNATYTGCDGVVGTVTTPDGKYTITPTITGGGSGYQLQADRVTASEDSDCTALIIDNLGHKTATGGLSATPHRCWGD